MAIGNAAWPIGVTMVGIHARTGREKIFARNVAHVLNDETQRKYIQVCLSFFPFLFVAIAVMSVPLWGVPDVRQKPLLDIVVGKNSC